MPNQWKIAHRKHWKTGKEYFQLYRLLNEQNQDIGSNRDYMRFTFSTEVNAQRAMRYLNRTNNQDNDR